MELPGNMLHHDIYRYGGTKLLHVGMEDLGPDIAQP